MMSSQCGPDIVKYFVVEPANDAVTGATGDFFVCSGTTFLKEIRGCSDSVDFNNNIFYNSGDVFFNTVITACTGIHTSNIYGCSPITVHNELILTSLLKLNTVSQDNSLTEFLVRDANDGEIKLRNLESIVSGITSQDTFVSGGTYNEGTTSIDFSGNSVETTFSVVLSGITSTIKNFWSGGSAGNYSVKQITDTTTDATGDYAVAINRNSRASGSASFAGGRGGVASGDYSIAYGVEVSATTTSSQAFGQTTIASGGASFATGTSTKSSGNNSFAMGSETTASGSNSFAGGDESILSGDVSLIYSTQSLLTGDRSVLLGGSNLTGTTNDTVYVPYLNVNSVGTGTSINNLGVDSNGNVVVGNESDNFYVSGGTYNNATKDINFSGNNSITTFDVDLSSLVSSVSGDTFVTSGNADVATSLLTFTNNSGGTFTVANSAALFSDNDINVTGGTYNPNNGCVTFGTNSGSTFDVCGFLTGFTNTFVTGTTFSSNQAVLSRNDGFEVFKFSGGSNVNLSSPSTNEITIDVSLPPTMNTFTTGFTYNNTNTFTITDNNSGVFNASINTMTGLTVNGTLSATTYFGDGSNLTGISTDDNYVTGGTYNSGTLTLNRQNGSVTVTGFTTDTNTTVTGFTYNDANTFTIGNSDGSNYSASINSVTGLTVNGDLTVNGKSVFSGNTTDVVEIYGSGTTSPIFRVQGSAGELFSISDSLVGELFAVNNISGLPIISVNSNNNILWGDSAVPSLNTTIKKSINMGTTEIYSIPVSAYNGGFFEYTVTGSGARAGSIMSIFSGTSVQFNETTTNDIGDTSGITFDMNISGGTANLTVSATTNSWEIKTIVRTI